MQQPLPDPAVGGVGSRMPCPTPRAAPVPALCSCRPSSYRVPAGPSAACSAPAAGHDSALNRPTDGNGPAPGTIELMDSVVSTRKESAERGGSGPFDDGPHEGAGCPAVPARPHPRPAHGQDHPRRGGVVRGGRAAAHQRPADPRAADRAAGGAADHERDRRARASSGSSAWWRGCSSRSGSPTWSGSRWWSLGAVVAVSLVAGRLLRLGPHLPEVAISAMLVLAVGGGRVGGAGRVIETLIGAAVGVVVNLVIAPPLYVQPASDAVGELADRMAGYARDLAGTLRGEWSRAAADRFLGEARELGAEVARADRRPGPHRGERAAQPARARGPGGAAPAAHRTHRRSSTPRSACGTLPGRCWTAPTTCRRTGRPGVRTAARSAGRRARRRRGGGGGVVPVAAGQPSRPRATRRGAPRNGRTSVATG